MHEDSKEYGLTEVTEGYLFVLHDLVGGQPYYLPTFSVQIDVCSDTIHHRRCLISYERGMNSYCSIFFI